MAANSTRSNHRSKPNTAHPALRSVWHGLSPSGGRVGLPFPGGEDTAFKGLWRLFARLAAGNELATENE